MSIPATQNLGQNHRPAFVDGLLLEMTQCCEFSGPTMFYHVFIHPPFSDGFLFKWGYPKTINFNMILHYIINQQFWGTPIYGNPQMLLALSQFQPTICHSNAGEVKGDG